MLQKGCKAAVEFYQQLSAVLNQVEPLMLRPESDGVAKKLITDFTGGSKFSAIASSTYGLTPFIKMARHQEQEAQITLAKAESLRNYMIVTSMALSVMIATILAFSTSRAIALGNYKK